MQTFGDVKQAIEVLVKDYANKDAQGKFQHNLELSETIKDEILLKLLALFTEYLLIDKAGVSHRYQEILSLFDNQSYRKPEYDWLLETLDDSMTNYLKKAYIVAEEVALKGIRKSNDFIITEDYYHTVRKMTSIPILQRIIEWLPYLSALTWLILVSPVILYFYLGCYLFTMLAIPFRNVLPTVFAILDDLGRGFIELATAIILKTIELHVFSLNKLCQNLVAKEPPLPRSVGFFEKKYNSLEIKLLVACLESYLQQKNTNKIYRTEFRNLIAAIQNIDDCLDDLTSKMNNINLLLMKKIDLFEQEELALQAVKEAQKYCNLHTDLSEDIVFI